MKLQNVKIILDADFKIISNKIIKMWDECKNNDIYEIFNIVEIASENKDEVVLTENQVSSLFDFLQYIEGSLLKISEDLGINLEYRD